MELIRLLDYTLKSPDKVAALQEINFSLTKGERISVTAHHRHDIRLFMRGLATLVSPTSGKFFFKGDELDFSDYRNLLTCKQKIGYIASDVSLISNRSVRDNLMLMVNYFKDTFSMTLPDDIMELCGMFQLDTKLDMRPTYLDPEKTRNVIIIREICKKPDVLLIERPKEFLGIKSYNTLKSVLRRLADTEIALVIYTLDKGFVREFSTREIVIEEGSVVEH